MINNAHFQITKNIFLKITVAIFVETGYIDGLLQVCYNPITNALELLQPCAGPLTIL